jgi:hypothetical protein
MNFTRRYTEYENKVMEELELWKKYIQQEPSFLDESAKKLQTKVNKYIPERIHKAITEAIKQVTKTVMSGAGMTTPRSILSDASLEEKETKILQRIRFYRGTAATEGAVTGYGGFLLGVADVALWLSIKMKMLFEIAANYGYDTADIRERIYIMYIFQLSFSSRMHRKKVFSILENWDAHVKSLPKDIGKMDWREYWEEYRDHLDLPKLLQLIPGFGALVGAIVNYNLTDRLGEFAMNAYRMRLRIGEE